MPGPKDGSGLVHAQGVTLVSQGRWSKTGHAAGAQLRGVVDSSSRSALRAMAAERAGDGFVTARGARGRGSRNCDDSTSDGDDA